MCYWLYILRLKLKQPRMYHLYAHKKCSDLIQRKVSIVGKTNLDNSFFLGLDLIDMLWQAKTSWGRNSSFQFRDFPTTNDDDTKDSNVSTAAASKDDLGSLVEVDGIMVLSHTNDALLLLS